MPQRRNPNTPEPPKAPRLPNFDPDPIMPASRDAAKMVYEYLQANPDDRRKVKRIASGPTDGVVQTLLQSGFKPDEVFRTNLLGLFDGAKKEIFLNDILASPDELAETVAHEFAHANGFGEDAADDIGRAYGWDRIQRTSKQRKVKK